MPPSTNTFENTPFEKPGIPTVKPRKRWSLRLLALALGCLPLVVGELLLRLLDWPQAAPAVDPLIDLHHLQPLFTLRPDGQTYFIGPERLNLFREAEFAAQKPAGTFRIFALGGSTTQGEPYSTPTAFPAWTGLDLQAASGRTVEVINCGGLSYASYRVKAILEEVLHYSPDLIILYCGQNEFLEERSYAGWRDVPLPLARASGWLNRFKVAQMTRWLVQGDADRAAKPSSSSTTLRREVDALLDYNGGLSAYHRDDPWREPVVAHFRWNLEQMVASCQTARVPIVLLRPVVNLLDCPPMKFETLSTLTPERRSAFETAWQTAQANADNPPIAAAELAKAYEIDPEHAGVNFFLGRLAFDSGNFQQARVYLQAANDLDVCPLRALSSIQDAVSQTAQATGVPLLDAEQLFVERSPHGLVGKKWLVDHVHPTIEGHRLLGEALCELILQQGWLPQRDEHWRASSQERMRAHLATLGEEYFQRGKQRLEGLMLWTQGRAKKTQPPVTQQ
ncbi:MAG: hypothetical protein IT423_08465 [Pirellulaceae bacterium]|nr:hypothetical protein [Pirellulaceae bacterium]